MAVWTLLMILIPGTLAQQNMKGKTFLFPKATITDHVTLSVNVTKPLEKMAVCLCFYTDLSPSCSLFSLTTNGKDNVFSIFLEPPNVYHVFINQELATFKTDVETLEQRIICVNWESRTGVVELWVNRKLYPRRVAAIGFSIAANVSAVLGQEMASLGFSQSFVGEMFDVNMWDNMLTRDFMYNGLYNGQTGTLIKWDSLHYRVTGDVLVMPYF